MQEYINIFLDITGNIATSITLGITLVTSASLLLVNIARYFQAKKYGIPIKMISPATLPDSLDVWVIVLSLFGFGLILPSFVANQEINIFAAIFIIFISCFANLVLIKGKAHYKHYHKTGRYTELEISLSDTLRGTAITSLFIAFLFLYVGYANRNMIVEHDFIGNAFFYVVYRAALILLLIYRILIAISFVICILAKIYGNKDTMTIDIDGHSYLLATQHSQFQWILVSCVLEKNETANGSFDDIVVFTKGRFIIRDMSSLDASHKIICREGYALLGVAPQEEKIENTQEIGNEGDENEESVDNSL